VKELSAREELRPQYTKAFQCIGSECEDTCCHGFAVTIDKATYLRYEGNAEFRSGLETHFARIDGNATDSAFARIRLTPDYNCPFLTRDRLCGIQIKHGSEYLSEVCVSYPRTSRRIDGLIEKALYLSCPEAARVVLLNPHLMKREKDENGSGSRYQRLLTVGDQVGKANASPHAYLWEIRSLTLALIRDRSYPLWQRLFILGLFCKRLDELVSTHMQALVPRLLREYAEALLEGKLRPLLDGIPEQRPLQLRLVSEVIERHLVLQSNDRGHARFRECVQDFLKGIEWDEVGPVESCTSAFAEARQRYYEPFMQAHPFILENYLVNHVFKTRFPFGVNHRGEPNTPQNEFLVMSVLFAAINGLLIGIAGHNREGFAMAHVVKLVQSFSKAVEHCSEFLPTLDPKLGSGAGMAQLLKN
jgi:lysine-N-methylase